MLTEKAIEIAIGGINGKIKPSKAERQAAYELFVELSSRTTTINDEDDDNRPAGEILSELTAMAEITRSILRSNGADSAKGRADGNVTLAVVALRVLNEVIVPRANRWSPLLREHEEARPEDFLGSAADWEKTWRDFRLCRDDLDSMRVEVRSYMDTLAKIAGAAALADVVVPVPPSAPTPARTLPSTVPPGAGRPKHKMVPWLDPIEAVRSLWAHHVAAKQLKDYGRAHVYPGPSGSGTIKIAHDDREDLWVDYVSDMGDAIDPTIAVAWQLTQEQISLPEDRSGELPKPPPTLPRGRLLVMGGDQIYPYASTDGYVDQLEMPYRLAAQASALVRDQRVEEPVEAEGEIDDLAADDVPENVLDDDSDVLENEPLLADLKQDGRHGHDIVAIPGNHDWLGGSKHFEKVFVDSTEFADNWNARQNRRWWAIKLTSRWWMWGLDTALDDTLDQEQIEYFEAASKELRAGDQVIICSPVPLWQLRQKRQDAYFEIRAILRRLIRDSGAHTPLFLAGDSHFFAHYRRVDGAADEHHITAGGGGAFLQPTHNLPEQVPYEQGAPDFKLGARWPRPVDSRGLGTNFGGIRGRQFLLLMLLLAGVHAATAGLVAARGSFDDSPSWADRIDDAFRWVAGSWAIWPLLLAFVAVTAKGNVPNSRESNLRSGAFRYGALHGVAHAGLFIAVAALALAVGPDRPGWRFVGAPLVGGVASTFLLIWFVRWINRAIRASDTLAFAPAHSTRYKHFVRMCFQPNGNLKLYVIGIDPVGEGWYRAITGRSGPSLTRAKQRSEAGVPSPGGAVVRRYLQRGLASRQPEWSAERLVPPYDSAGVPKLHYVWGRHFRSASSELLLERERILGVDHPDTIFSRTQRAEALVRYHETAESVALLERNVTSCERRFGANHRTTLANRALLGDGLLAMGNTDRGLEELSKVIEGRQSTIDTAAGDVGALTHGEQMRRRRARQAQIHFACAANDHERFDNACAVLEASDVDQSVDLAPQALVELARAYTGLGRLEEARETLDAAERLLSTQTERRTAGSVDVERLRLVAAIAKAELHGDDETQRQALRRLLQVCERRFGDSDPVSVNARRALGQALVRDRTSRKGIGMLRKNVEILDEALGAHHETVKARQLLAAALVRQLDRSGAQVQFEKIAEFHEAFGNDSHDALNSLLEAAIVSFEDDQDDGVMRLQALLERVQSPAVDPGFRLAVRLALARCFTKQEHFDQANQEYGQLADDARRWAYLVGPTNEHAPRFLTEVRMAWAESLELEGRIDDSCDLYMTAFEEGPRDVGASLMWLKRTSMESKHFRGGNAEFTNSAEVAEYLQGSALTSEEREQIDPFLDYLSTYEDPDTAIPILEAWPEDNAYRIDDFLAKARLNRRRAEVADQWQCYWSDAEDEQPFHEYQAGTIRAMEQILSEAATRWWTASQPVIEMRIDLANMYATVWERLPDGVDESTFAAQALDQWEEVAAVVGERIPDSALHTSALLNVAVLSLVCDDPERAVAMCTLVHDRLDEMPMADAKAILEAGMPDGCRLDGTENTPDDVVSLKTLLARAYLATGRLDEAAAVANQAVELAAATFPRGHFARDEASEVLAETLAEREAAR